MVYHSPTTLHTTLSTRSRSRMLSFLSWIPSLAVRLELSPAWTQISVSLIRTLNSLNLYSEEEPGNCGAAPLHGYLSVKLELRAADVNFSSAGLQAGWLSGYKLILMSGDWTRLDYGYAAMNHILMLSLSSVSKCSRWEHKMWELCSWCLLVRMSDQGWSHLSLLTQF